jgi:hypothetical protein
LTTHAELSAVRGRCEAAWPSQESRCEAVMGVVTP